MLEGKHIIRAMLSCVLLFAMEASRCRYSETEHWFWRLMRIIVVKCIVLHSTLYYNHLKQIFVIRYLIFRNIECYCQEHLCRTTWMNCFLYLIFWNHYNSQVARRFFKNLELLKLKMRFKSCNCCSNRWCSGGWKKMLKNPSLQKRKLLLRYWSFSFFFYLVLSTLLKKKWLNHLHFTDKHNIGYYLWWKV